MKKMEQMIKEYYIKYKEKTMYLFFGFLTTIVNYVVYVICNVCGLNTVISTILAWIFAVLFAFLTNRKYVFKSERNGINNIFKEISKFFGARLLTGVLDVIIMVVCVDLLEMNEYIIKILSNVIVIVLNYILSKLWIFKKK